jgi:hypothetical protein
MIVYALYHPRSDGSWSVAFANTDYQDRANQDTEILWLCECKNPDKDPSFARDRRYKNPPAVGDTGDVDALTQKVALYGSPHPRSYANWRPKRFKSLAAAQRYASDFAKKRGWTIADSS